MKPAGLFRAMIVEEWRIHSTLFGSVMFVLFPVLLVGFSFACSVALPFLALLLPLRTIALIVHSVFLLFGASIGSFGLLGREALNRRFGQASLVAFSSRNLPVSERTILANFVAKDALYYLFLWVFPFVLGFAGACLAFYPVLFFPFVPLLFLTLSLSFLVGLSVVFLLSTIYVRVGKIAAILSVLAIPAIAALFALPAEKLLPPLSYFRFQDFPSLALSLLLVFVPSAISVLLFDVEYTPKKMRHSEELLPLSRRLRVFRSLSFLVAKDMLDLYRSDGGFGKILFTLLVPLGLTSLILSTFLSLIPSADFVLVFSIFLGIISSSLYNWLTDFDVSSAYSSSLPLKQSIVMRAKILGYLLLNGLSLAVLLAVVVLKGTANFLPALLAFAGTSLYSLAVTTLLGGLAPNVLLYNAKNFLLYFALIAPVALACFFLSFASTLSLAAFSVLLLPVGWALLKKSYRRADESEQFF
jgi:hypothetical protein